MNAPTCRRCGETVRRDDEDQHSPRRDAVIRVCACPDGPLWTDRPHMDQLLQQI